jgi:hypothetical protein
MERLEALADAIMKLNGWSDPSSQAFQNRNPLLLRAYSLSRAQAQDEKGVRIFPSLLGGYRAALNDLFEKCDGEYGQGRSRSKLDRTSSLQDLLRVHHLHLAERKAVLFLQAALRDDSVHGRTPLAWFLQTDAKNAVASG